MNNYPAWWADTITVYNKYVDPQTRVVKWYRRVLTDCFWKFAHERVIVKNVVIETDTTKCRIPKNEDFLQAGVWKKLPNDELSSKFTLAIGDIIIHGEVDDVIDEYVSGSRASDLLTRYKDTGCFTIDSVTIDVHESRCAEHYYVKGT